MRILPDKSYNRNIASYPERAVFPSPWEGVGGLQKIVVLLPRCTGPLHLQILAALRLQMLAALRLQKLTVLRLRMPALLRLQMLAPLHLQMLAPLRIQMPALLRPKKF